jgi:hypothetical protein
MKHRTLPQDAFVESWVPLDADWEITAPPVSDRAHALPTGEPVTARLTYADAKAFAALIGAQLPSPAQIERLHEMATRGEALELEAYSGTPRAETDLEHSIRHDANMRRQIATLGWNGRVPLANWGKSWVAGAPPGRAQLMGWWVPRVEQYGILERTGPGFVQPRPLPGPGPHLDSHHDDGTTTLLVRRRARATDVSLDGDASVPPGLLSVVPGGAAIVASAAAALEAELDTEQEPVGIPHGYRAAVWELIEDAKANGTWRPRGSGYRPKRGDLLCSARAGQNPEKRGSGHVEVVVEPSGPLRVHPLTLGGNEANQIVEADFDLEQPDYLGCIERGEVGRRALEVALVEYARGDVKEIAGALHNKRIQMYLAGCRRGGSPFAGMPGHQTEGGGTLGVSPPDEIPWCAAMASWCTSEALRDAA